LSGVVAWYEGIDAAVLPGEDFELYDTQSTSYSAAQRAPERSFGALATPETAGAFEIEQENG